MLTSTAAGAIEARRLEALRTYELIDTAPEPALDDLAALAGYVCDAPISLISLIDENRQWFKSNRGMPYPETPRDVSFCSHAIAQADVMIVRDALNDPRFALNPMVTGEPHVRFYAGAPLVTADGFALGTLCVMDRVPRALSESQMNALRILSRQVMSQFDVRLQTLELIASEARLMRVFRSCPVGVAIHRWSDRTFVDVNDAFITLFGWSREELAGHTTQEMNILGEAASAGLRKRLVKGELLGGTELACRARDGAMRQVIMGSVLLDLHHVPHTITTFVDITERKRAENAASRLTAIVESSDDAIIGRDVSGRITSWNGGASAIFGYAASEMIGRSIMRLIPRGRWEEEGRALDRIGRNEIVKQFETQRLTQDGRLIDVSVTTSPVRDAEGKVIGTSKVARDITDRRRADVALRESEERMRFALENADVGVWDIDYRTRVIRWSSILERQYGLETGSFAGTFESFEANVHPDDRAELMERLRKAELTGEDFAFVHRAIWPDGSTRWLSGAGRIKLDEHRKPVRGLGISIDVTERRALEERYRQAQKMEAIGRLAGGIAHDFNNLLTVILGYCEILMLGLPADGEERADVAEIQRAGMHASRLTRQLLAFGRKQIIEPTLVSLNDVASDIQSMLRRVIPEDVKIELQLGLDLWLVMADRGQLEQILMNLTVNARDAMPDGGTLVIRTANAVIDDATARADLTAAPGAYVALSVSDTGVGMTLDVQARVFEPFFTTKEVGKGTGLGMSTVYGIAKRAGGTVEIESAPGRGTTFTVLLPRAAASTLPVETPVSSHPHSARAGTILVVEDENAVRELARRLLRLDGYTAIVASNAAEARHLFDENPSIDVLLTDVVMPGTSGAELARSLLEIRPTLKVVYMSGYASESIVLQATPNNSVILLHKPFTSESLGEKIREALVQ